MSGGETEVGEATAGARPRCRAFLREHRDQILEAWELSMRTLPSARALDHVVLLDQLPELLDHIGGLADELGGAAPQTTTTISEAHAIERLSQGFNLVEVVLELGILRTCITQVWGHESTSPCDLTQLDQAIDRTIADEIDRYSKARERTVQTFERIANAALESRNLDDLLGRLLRILVEASDSIDMGTILVRDGDLLRVRASVGPNAEDAGASTQRIGEGFAGTIAATREPLAIRHEVASSMIKRPTLRESGVRAIYGIPLMQDHEVIAVAHIGSLTVDELSADDRRLFRAIAARATEAINQYLIRETAERTAAVLRERELEFRMLADNIPQFAWIADERGNLYWYNQRWLDYTGTTLEQMRRAGPELTLHPEHAERVMAKLKAAFAAGTTWEDTVPMRGKDGRYRWFLSRAIPIRNETGTIVRWFGTNTDITNQRFLDEATKVLNSSLNYDETLEQTAHLAVPDVADWCVVDLVDEPAGVRRVALAHADPTRIELAREWVRKYPLSGHESTGVTDVIRTGVAQLLPVVTTEHLARLSRDPEHLQALGELGMKSWIVAPLIARGRTLGVITWVTTDSDRYYHETDLELAKELGRRAGIAVDNARLYEESQHALHEREVALQSRDEVLAIVSHDLRNPLGAIGMSASCLLEDETLEPLVKKQVLLIQRSANRMSHLINDLLDMATIQAKGLTLHRTEEDAEQIIMAVIDAHQGRAAEKTMTITGETDLASVRLWCDRDRVEQVFGNLIGNAIKYCRPGDAIRVGGRVVDGQVLFSVADTGPGIAADEIPHLFEPYWAVKRQGTKQGSGLGLYICRGIVEGHGGRIWITSEIGKGTEIFFTLPLTRDADRVA